MGWALGAGPRRLPHRPLSLLGSQTQKSSVGSLVGVGALPAHRPLHPLRVTVPDRLLSS